jgi:proteasome lid subunit RPN8/RPN11
MKVLLTLTEDQHRELERHLYPGDGLEAVAFIACGRAAGTNRHRLVARSIFPIPHDQCDRHRNSVTWQAPESIDELLTLAEMEGLSLVKVHSHPQGFDRFSGVDNASDAELLPTLQSWIGADIPHGSAIMLPGGKLIGRYTWNKEVLKEFDGIGIIGSSLDFSWMDDEPTVVHEFGASQDQAFGEGTTRRLQKLRVAVVGASGTGGPIIEQLARLGVGHLVLVDDDKIEERNLNRIPFATAEDAKNGIYKVVSAANDIARKGLSTGVTTIIGTLQTPAAIRAIAECDVIFGCVDTAYGRLVMNMAATHYLLPYFDVGILLDAEQDGEKRGKIKDILGTVHYLVPGRSSLLTRDKFTMQDVVAEALHKNDPTAANQQVQDKYIKGIQVHRPAVISVNTLAASLAVNDFLARLHPYRKLENSDVASIEFSLGEVRLTVDEEMEPCNMMNMWLGYGDRNPLLGLTDLSK